MIKITVRKAFQYIGTIRRLGFKNVAYVAWYRFTLYSGIRKKFFPECAFPQIDTDCYHPGGRRLDYPRELKKALFDDADKVIQGQLRYFAHHWKFVGNPPNWFLNPFNGKIWTNPRQHWTHIGDFNTGIGDIKNLWEASRFEWAVTLSRAYSISGKVLYLDILNQWLKDWAEKNPANAGPNWKCGQEASIRVFNLIQSALILNQWEHPNTILINFIYRHLERISGNIRYAIAQDNNHGISEAAALFIGGQWCAKNSTLDVLRKRCDHLSRQGRKWLENRIEKLVEEDGSFSQHSVNYHRVLLDTLSFVEYWRRKLSIELLSVKFYQRAKAAIHWMIMFTDAISGKAPNLGANDGALLLNFHACDYQDFRPSIQMAYILFHNKKYFAPGLWDEPCYWLGLGEGGAENCVQQKDSEVLSGGYVIMTGKDSWGMIRFPVFRFRPVHNDVFHFDLWYKGKNICRDAGSYSYNPEDKSAEVYFQSVKAHNTVGFDNFEQMPQLGRFLLGKWIRSHHVNAIEKNKDGSDYWTGAYQDYRGNRHSRTIIKKENTWVVEDVFAGSFKKAEIIFRLIPDDYRLVGNRIAASWGTIEISGSGCEILMSKGLESLYYWQKQTIDTLVLHTAKHSEKIITRFILQK